MTVLSKLALFSFSGLAFTVATVQAQGADVVPAHGAGKDAKDCPYKAKLERKALIKMAEEKGDDALKAIIEQRLVKNVKTPLFAAYEAYADSYMSKVGEYETEAKKSKGLRGLQTTVEKLPITVSNEIVERKLYLSDYMTCPSGAPALKTVNFVESDYDSVYDLIQRKYNALLEAQGGAPGTVGSMCTQASCPTTDFAGCVVRLAGHDLLDFDNTQSEESGLRGGADGCIDFSDADNRGLAECVDQDLASLISGDSQRTL